MRLGTVLTFVLLSMGCAHAQRPTPPSTPFDAAEQHYWPPGRLIEHPVVRNGQVEEYAQPAPALAEAEVAFRAKRWDEAEAGYLRALEQCPTCYAALTGWADVEITRKDGDVVAALRRYEQALELNSTDPQLHAFRASTLFRLGRGKDGVQELVEALVLRPRYKFALALAEQAKAVLRLPLNLDVEPLSPTGRLVSTKPNEMGYVNAGRVPNTLDDLPWIMYGTCRWVGPNNEFKGDLAAMRPWDAQVEAKCLAKVADGFKAQAGIVAKMEKEKKVRLLQHTAGLTRLANANDAGYLAEFVTYEIQSRMEPQVTLTLRGEQRARLQLYVERFVLGLKNDGAEATAAPVTPSR